MKTFENEQLQEEAFLNFFIFLKTASQKNSAVISPLAWTFITGKIDFDH